MFPIIQNLMNQIAEEFQIPLLQQRIDEAFDSLQCSQQLVKGTRCKVRALEPKEMCKRHTALALKERCVHVMKNGNACKRYAILRGCCKQHLSKVPELEEPEVESPVPELEEPEDSPVPVPETPEPVEPEVESPVPVEDETPEPMDPKPDSPVPETPEPVVESVPFAPEENKWEELLPPPNQENEDDQVVNNEQIFKFENLNTTTCCYSDAKAYPTRNNYILCTTLASSSKQKFIPVKKGGKEVKDDDGKRVFRMALYSEKLCEEHNQLVTSQTNPNIKRLYALKHTPIEAYKYFTRWEPKQSKATSLWYLNFINIGMVYTRDGPIAVGLTQPYNPTVFFWPPRYDEDDADAHVRFHNKGLLYQILPDEEVWRNYDLPYKMNNPRSSDEAKSYGFTSFEMMLKHRPTLYIKYWNIWNERKIKNFTELLEWYPEQPTGPRLYPRPRPCNGVCSTTKTKRCEDCKLFYKRFWEQGIEDRGTDTDELYNQLKTGGLGHWLNGICIPAPPLESLHEHFDAIAYCQEWYQMNNTGASLPNYYRPPVYMIYPMPHEKDEWYEKNKFNPETLLAAIGKPRGLDPATAIHYHCNWTRYEIDVQLGRDCWPQVFDDFARPELCSSVWDKYPMATLPMPPPVSKYFLKDSQLNAENLSFYTHYSDFRDGERSHEQAVAEARSSDTTSEWFCTFRFPDRLDAYRAYYEDKIEWDDSLWKGK